MSGKKKKDYNRVWLGHQTLLQSKIHLTYRSLPQPQSPPVCGSLCSSSQPRGAHSTVVLLLNDYPHEQTDRRSSDYSKGQLYLHSLGREEAKGQESNPDLFFGVPEKPINIQFIMCCVTVLRITATSFNVTAKQSL